MVVLMLHCHGERRSAVAFIGIILHSVFVRLGMVLVLELLGVN